MRQRIKTEQWTISLTYFHCLLEHLLLSYPYTVSVESFPARYVWQPHRSPRPPTSTILLASWNDHVHCGRRHATGSAQSPGGADTAGGWCSARHVLTRSSASVQSRSCPSARRPRPGLTVLSACSEALQFPATKAIPTNWIFLNRCLVRDANTRNYLP